MSVTQQVSKSGISLAHTHGPCMLWYMCHTYHAQQAEKPKDMSAVYIQRISQVVVKVEAVVMMETYDGSMPDYIGQNDLQR